MNETLYGLCCLELLLTDYKRKVEHEPIQPILLVSFSLGFMVKPSLSIVTSLADLKTECKSDDLKLRNVFTFLVKVPFWIPAPTHGMQAVPWISQKAETTRCPSVSTWINKIWYIHSREYYLAIKGLKDWYMLQHG